MTTLNIRDDSYEAITPEQHGERTRVYEDYKVEEVTSSHEYFAAIQRIAARIQGEDYVRSGYIEPEKLTSEGLMPYDPAEKALDVTYYVAHPKSGDLGDIEGSLKKVTPKDGKSIEDLPAYKYIDGKLHSGWNEYLHQNAGNIIEIVALCRAENATSNMVSHEIMREIMQKAILEKSDEQWLMTFADKAFRAMTASFGERVIRRIGEPYTIDEPDEHVTLYPCIINPRTVLQDLTQTIENGGMPDDLATRRIMTLVFMADGLDLTDENETPIETRVYLDKLNALASDI